MGVICESSIHVFVFECCVKHRHYNQAYIQDSDMGAGPTDETMYEHVSLGHKLKLKSLQIYSTDHKQLNIYLRVLTKSSQVRIAYSRVCILCSRAEVLHLLVRTRELQVPRSRTLQMEALYAYVRD